MSKFKTYLFLLFISTSVFVSCTRDNYLDIQPLGEFIPSTVNDYRLLLDNVDGQPVNGRNITDGFNEKHILPFMVTDNIGLVDGQQTNITLRNAYLFNEQFYGMQEEDYAWRIYYNQIFLANVILDGLTRVTDGTISEINQLAAEAKLHRAFAYFSLVNIYGVHYDPATADADLGVPLRLGIELEDVDLTRASVKSVYEFIITEIANSIDDLPDTVPMEFSFRPSKAGAWGLLSKVHLYQANYELALDAVENALDLSNDLTDFNQVDVVNGVRSFPPVQQDSEILWFKENNPGSIGLSLIVTDELLELYTSDDDLRNDWFAPIPINDDSFLAYNAGELNQNYADGINVPELYLISAECNVRLNNIQRANRDLNRLRRNRFNDNTFTPINISNQTVLLRFVKEERRREMVGSGDRTFDIKRYNRFDNEVISLTHSFNQETAILEANSLNWAFPIGQLYINQNPEIIQNPRN